MADKIFKNDPNIIIDSDVKNYFLPKYIFIPVESGYTLTVKDNSYVYKNEIVMKKEQSLIRSNISGRVLGIKDMLFYPNRKKTCLVIQNDFKENVKFKKSVRKYISHIKYKEFLNLLADNEIIYKGKNILDKLLNKNQNLIINAVDEDPYFKNKYFYLEKYYEEILETINVLDNMFHYKNVYFSLKNTDSSVINSIMNQIGTYPNIKVNFVNDSYPDGLDEMVKHNLRIDDAMILSVQEIVEIYNVLKKECTYDLCNLTIAGNAVKPRAVINVKKGTLLSELFINNFNFTNKMVDVYINGTLYGEKIETLNYVITNDIDGIIINIKEEKNTSKCSNCGLCVKFCPMGLNPKYCLNHKDKLSESFKEKCIGCGVCNYVCPSNIKLKMKAKGE